MSPECFMCLPYIIIKAFQAHIHMPHIQTHRRALIAFLLIVYASISPMLHLKTSFTAPYGAASGICDLNVCIKPKECEPCFYAHIRSSAVCAHVCVYIVLGCSGILYRALLQNQRGASSFNLILHE